MNEFQTKSTDYQDGWRDGVAQAMTAFDREMNATGDVKNAWHAMKVLVRFGPQESKQASK